MEPPGGLVAMMRTTRVGHAGCAAASASVNAIAAKTSTRMQEVYLGR